MTTPCQAPIPDETLLSYWVGDATPNEVEDIEAHLFGCGSCTERLGDLASMGKGLATLARRGGLSGIVSRTLFNRMQRDGLKVRLYALSPGETVPCAVFQDDDVVVASLRADFSKVQSVALSVTGPDDMPVARFTDIPVDPDEGEVFWALPGDVVRQMPSIRLALALTSATDEHAVVGEYVLEHTGVADV